jgi:multidrug efflux pump subunit AcrB
LARIRATLIPALAVPVSLIAIFAMFPLLGFSINTIALMGWVLAIGLVVADAIAVVTGQENEIVYNGQNRDQEPAERARHARVPEKEAEFHPDYEGQS